MDRANDTIIERVRIREVAGVFRSRDALDATVDALSESGFDRKPNSKGFSVYCGKMLLNLWSRA